MTPSPCRQLDVNSRRRRRMGFDSRLTPAAAGSESPLAVPSTQPTPSADLDRGSNAWFAGSARARFFSAPDRMRIDRAARANAPTTPQTIPFIKKTSELTSIACCCGWGERIPARATQRGISIEAAKRGNRMSRGARARAFRKVCGAGAIGRVCLAARRRRRFGAAASGKFSAMPRRRRTRARERADRSATPSAPDAQPAPGPRRAPSRSRPSVQGA